MSNQRFKFIDGFKGLAVLFYIFSISGGGNYRSFTPVSWHLMSFSDAVFPSLLFITGVSTGFAFHRSQHPSKRWPLIFARSFVTWVLGIVMSNKTNNIQYLHYSGIFQIMSLSYLLICTVERVFPIQSKLGSNQVSSRNFVLRVILMLLLPAINLALTFLYDEKDPRSGIECPRGYQGPGGIGDDHEYTLCTGGAARLIDLRIFGQDHLEKSPSCSTVYYCQSFERFGVLPSLNAIFTAFLGSVWATLYIQWNSSLPND